MSALTPISTDAAPAAIGTYSQAIASGQLVFASGQIPLTSDGEMVSGDIDAEVAQVFDNLAAVATAAGGSLANIVKLTVYLTDLGHFEAVNRAMAARFSAPYPARAAVGVAALPRAARVEADAILVIAS